MEKAVIEQSLKGAEDYLFALNQEQDLTEAIQKLAVLKLEQERQALEDLMIPYERYIEDLQFEIDAEKTRNQLRVLDLEMEKRALEDLLIPLEIQAEKIQRSIDLINNEIEVANYYYETQVLHYKLLNAQEEVRRSELALTRVKYEELFNDVITQFVNILSQSQAFTLSESYEVAKRLGLWTEQIEKLSEVEKAFSNIRLEAIEVAEAINAIPKDVTIRIRTETSTVSVPAEDVPSFATGGTIPGPYGKPILIVAHGGEQFLGLGRKVPTMVQTTQSRTINNNMGSNVYNTNYNVNANYEKQQSPGNIAMDLRAIASRARR